MYSLFMAGSQKPGSLQGRAPFGGSEDNPSSPLPLPVAPGAAWHIAAKLQALHVASPLPPCSRLFLRHLGIGFRANVG
jgi:hypothetical protein